MAKRLTEKEKEEIVKRFSIGCTIEELSTEFNCTKLTVSRNLKKNLGENKFKQYLKNSKPLSKVPNEKKDISVMQEKNQNKYNDDFNQEKMTYDEKEEGFSSLTPFVEITPLDFDIEKNTQVDLSSISISEIEFPKIVYMIVDKKTELETKYLKDYPDWQFLSQDELNRKTIEIFIDLKSAKRFCNKEQKVIKVPNTEVFRIVAPILLSKGISRIVNSDKLIAL